MVSVSVSGVSTKSKPSGKIAPESLIVSTLWKSSPDDLDPPPQPPPAFQCRCKRCAKSLAVTVTPSSEADKLEVFRNVDVLCLNTGTDTYLKIYTGEEEALGNLFISCERVRKKGDSCIIFIDVWGRIVFQSERLGEVATVKSGDTTLGIIRGNPGSIFSFRRNFSIIPYQENLPMEGENRIKLQARGCLSKAFRCSFMNAFYLDEFAITDPQGQEMGWIKDSGKKIGPTIHFSQNIKDDCNSKGLILAAAATLFELFMQPYLGYNLGSVGLMYVVVLSFLAILVGFLVYVYHYGVGSVMIF